MRNSIVNLLTQSILAESISLFSTFRTPLIVQPKAGQKEAKIITIIDAARNVGKSTIA